jgi:hypothetical protein
MRRLNLPLVFVLILFFAVSLTAQTPQYYNYNNVGASSNTFPFGQTAGKAVQWLFLAGDFNQPAPLPPGNQITKVWYFITTGGTRTFTDLTILMAQDTIVTLTTGAFYSGTMDTVYHKASVTLTGPTNGWMSITLDTPYPYDPTKSLIVMTGQCASTGSGMYVRQNVLPNIRRVWSVGGCPFAPYAGGDGSTLNFGVDVEPAVNFTPTHLYYKFEDNMTGNMTPNCANPGVGTNPSPYASVTVTPGGQFDSCITGTGLASAGVTTGWNWNMGSSSWTISLWMEIPTSTSGTAYYLFGDPGAGSFRCFHNGVAGSNNLVLRGTGITDVNVTGIGPSPTVVTFVYDSTTHTIKAFKNGVVANTVVQSQLNMTTGTGFKFGGYSSSPSFIGKVDECRIYNRALSDAEVAASWNQDIACGLVTGIGNNNFEIPQNYMLSQNYPNPFNPVTKISFAIPKSGIVTLKVYDILGKEVAVLVNAQKNAGSYIVDFDASALTSGVYFYKLEVNGFVDTKKMIVLK